MMMILKKKRTLYWINESRHWSSEAVNITERETASQPYYVLPNSWWKHIILPGEFCQKLKLESDLASPSNYKSTGYIGDKEMATHSNILAWRILWTEEPGGLLSMGSHGVGHDWSNFAYTRALEREMATLQYSCLENPRDREAWWAAIYGVAQSQTWLKQLSSSSSSSSNSLYD